MRRWIALGCLALAFVAAPSASAKGPFEVCGASGCRVLAAETQPPIRFGLDPSVLAAPAASPAPYFIIGFSGIHPTDSAVSVLAYWVPSASMLRFESGRWMSALASETAVLRDATSGMQPYRPPTAVVAYVDYQPVKRSTGYLTLFTIGTPVTLTGRRSWYEVWLRGGHSPWNDGSSQIWISRTGNYLMRDGMMLAIPTLVADRIRKRLPLG